MCGVYGGSYTHILYINGILIHNISSICEGINGVLITISSIYEGINRVISISSTWEHINGVLHS